MKYFYNSLAGIAVCLTAQLPHAFAQETGELASNLLDLGLEELMQIQVISAPGFSSDPRDIPSAVTVISAEDIRMYGWQTLADVLNTLPGFSITNDYTYSYAAVRGLAVSGDWRSRMQILINGISVNENIYDSITIDSAFPINLAQIDHIEVIRGPSASVYGSNSMFGVINIVTRSGNDIRGAEFSSLQASGKFQRQSALWGRTVGEMDVMVAGSFFEGNGRSLTFPELSAANQPAQADGIDAEEGYNFSSRFLFQNWRLSLYLSNREKIVPTGSYGTRLNDANHYEKDTNALAELGHRIEAGTTFSWDNRIYYGNYEYDGQFPYDYEFDYVLNRDEADGKWWGYESAVNAKLGTRNTLIAGFSYKNNYTQSMKNYDLGFNCGGETEHTCLQSTTDSENVSLYLQDEIRLFANTHMTLGWRLDEATGLDSNHSPRLGLIHNFRKFGSIKYLYAEAFRNPNPYERFYNFEGFYSNPDLKAESMKSHEITWETSIFASQQLVLSYYKYELDDFIFNETGQPLSNMYGFKSEGAEASLTGRFASGISYFTSITYQDTLNQGTNLHQGAPSYLFKFNISAPLPIAGLSAAAEFRAVSHRYTFLQNAEIGGYGTTNLAFNYRPEAARWSVRSGVQDVFDREYYDPVADDPLMAIPRDRIRQLGRSWFAEFAYKY